MGIYVIPDHIQIQFWERTWTNLGFGKQAVEYFQRVLSMQQDNGEVWSALGKWNVIGTLRLSGAVII